LLIQQLATQSAWKQQAFAVDACNYGHHALARALRYQC